LILFAELVTCSAKKGLAWVELLSGAPGVVLWRDLATTPRPQEEIY